MVLDCSQQHHVWAAACAEAANAVGVIGTPAASAAAAEWSALGQAGKNSPKARTEL